MTSPFRWRISRWFFTHLLMMIGACAPLPAGAGPPAECRQPVPVSPQTGAPVLDASALHIAADRIEARGNDTTIFSGNVHLQRGDQELMADQITYYKPGDEVMARGSVTLRNRAGDLYQTPELSLNLNTHTGYTGHSAYFLGKYGARGDAERIDFEGPDLTRLKDVRYTTCAEGQDSWFLKINELELDTAADIGAAYHASVSFMRVPVFYLPYFRFPISSKRKSGFLVPSAGHTDKLGTVIATPYYLNLAPNYDATITPRHMSRRGLQFQNEFRYLGAHSNGEADLEYLAGDDRFNNENRAAGSVRHQHAFGPSWSANVDLRGVSDKDYLDDFGDNLGITSQTHLPQNADLNYRDDTWNFTARASDFQTVDRTIAAADRPYARLPQLLLSTNPGILTNVPQYHFEGELVNFEHDSRLSGRRFNVNPGISYPLASSYGFLTPKIGVRHIAYDLSGSGDTRPSVTRGAFSLDSGLFFDREMKRDGRFYIHTLEPRLFYLYIPDKNQDVLPNFDTSEPDFNFANLFRENRFVGGDRVGDANQATVALTSRLLDDDEGIERVRGSIGRIYYFDDRKVNLPAGTTTNHVSDIAAEVEARLAGNWFFQGTFQREWNVADTKKSGVYLQYNPKKDRILNLGRRFIRNQLEQTDVSVEWPIYGRWTFRGRSLYSQRDDHSLETYAGLEYDACCWALRVFSSTRLSETGKQIRAIMFEFEFSGLAKRGAAPLQPLEQSVFSFTDAPSISY